MEITIKSEYTCLSDSVWDERIAHAKALGEGYMDRCSEGDRGLMIFPTAYPEGKEVPVAAVIAKHDWTLYHKQEMVHSLCQLLAKAAVIGTLDNVNLDEILKLVK